MAFAQCMIKDGGVFTHTETNVIFEYTLDMSSHLWINEFSDKEENDFYDTCNCLIFVKDVFDPSGISTRVAKIKKTVIHVLTGRGEVEKWQIKNHKKYKN